MAGWGVWGGGQMGRQVGGGLVVVGDGGEIMVVG